MKKGCLTFIILIIFVVRGFAQDPQFTQFYANPLYLNPALAGSEICPRVNINYRNQWPGISGTYVTTTASIDKYIYKIKGGLGFLASYDMAGQGTLNTASISAMYSYQLRIKRNFAINFGLQGSYGQKSLNLNKLNFGDMIDEKYGFVNITGENQIRSQKSYTDFSAGMVAFTKRLFAGVAVNHLTQPDEGLIYVSRLPMKYTFHAGGIFHLNGEKSDVTISPNVLYQHQKDFSQLNFGLYFTKGAIVGGIWYRNNDAFIFLVGFQRQKIKIGYTYDITISKLTNATAGAHELSLGFMFRCIKPKPKYRPGICPVF